MLARFLQSAVVVQGKRLEEPKKWLADLVRTYGTLQPQVWRDTRTRGESMESSKWALGDSVVVKPGVTDPVTGSALGGWQGRLIALEDQRDRLSIQWDSLTLKSIPPTFLLTYEEWGMPWSALRLATRDVLPTAARDREEDVLVTIAALEAQYSWLSLGEQGRRIRQIVYRTEERDLFAPFRAWHAYLEEHLAVPFVASVVEHQRG